MKGFFGLKGIILLAAFILLFGGAFYDLTTTTTRCGLSITNPEMNYSCDDMVSTVGKTVIMPDQNIGKGVNGIVTMKNLDNETLSKLGVMYSSQKASFMNQIILGGVGLAVLFGILAYVFVKLSPASGIDAGSLFMSLFAAFLVLSLIMVAFDDSPEPGIFSVFGDRTPFKGVRTLIKYPDVFMDAVDETSLLPGTLTTGDILNGTSQEG